MKVDFDDDRVIGLQHRDRRLRRRNVHACSLLSIGLGLAIAFTLTRALAAGGPESAQGAPGALRPEDFAELPHEGLLLIRRYVAEHFELIGGWRHTLRACLLAKPESAGGQNEAG